MIKIGRSGIGGAKDAEANIDILKENKVGAAEIAFTYGVYLKKPDAIRIGEHAKKQGIDLSIHAPYFINLNSKDKTKIVASKKRILKCCEWAHYMQIKYIVFHAAFYTGISKEDTYAQVKIEMLDLQKTIKENGWKVILAPETTGKASQFGDLDELIQLAKDTKCQFTVDFSHIKARNNGVIDYPEIMKKLKPFKHIHSHFSGIEFTEKGERRHLITPESEIKELFKHIKKANIDITIINESPDPGADAVKMLKLL